MIFNPAWALNASTSALVWSIISSIGRSNWKFTGLTLNLALASASGLLSSSFMRLLVLVCFSFHRRACLLGSRPTNRFLNYSRDIPVSSLQHKLHLGCGGMPHRRTCLTSHLAEGSAHFHGVDGSGA